MAVSLDGRHIVSASFDGDIKIWDTRHFRRLPHCLIRQRVRATYAAPLADLSLRTRELYHFVYCRNDPDVPKELHMRVIPARGFALVIKHLVG